MSYQEEYGESLLGSSPPCRPVIADASDLFRAVMDDLIQEDSKISRTEMERYKSAKLSVDSSLRAEDSKSERCQRCNSVLKLCSCISRGSFSSSDRGNHVHWVDEVWDKPLCEEQAYDSDFKRTPSPEGRRNSIKPILKHKATCIIIVSDR